MLTVVSGPDMVNITYLNFMAFQEETAKVNDLHKNNYMVLIVIMTVYKYTSAYQGAACACLVHDMVCRFVFSSYKQV